MISRRAFLKDGVAAFTISFAAPAFLSDLARAQGASSRKALGLHPKLTGLKDIFNQGRLAFIQRVGYENSSRSHFSGTDIWSTANPPNTIGNGWVGRYLATLPAPLDPLSAWNTTADAP